MSAAGAPANVAGGAVSAAGAPTAVEGGTVAAAGFPAAGTAATGAAAAVLGSQVARAVNALPQTGAGRLTLVAGLGAILVAVGGLTLLAVRRRRMLEP